MRSSCCCHCSCYNASILLNTQIRGGHVNAKKYDAWYDSARGRLIFDAELRCLRRLVTDAFRPWLEIGVGTGRFAQALGVEEGIDPSPEMLQFAAERGVETRLGVGEDLPYPDASFGGVLMVSALCFVQDASAVLHEAARVLRPDGRLVIGTIPAESLWGKAYAERGRAGHPMYSKARFLRAEETIALVKSAGFEKRAVYSTLMQGPDDDIVRPLVWPALLPASGFLAIGFSLKDPDSRRTMENVPYSMRSL